MPANPGWGATLPDALPEPWASLLGDAIKDQIAALGSTLSERSSSEQIVPDPTQVFRALELAPENVRAVIIGQDPYPNAAHAMGLSFSVPTGTTPLPASARNIRRELADDLGLWLPEYFDLSEWVSRGVLLLNRHLTSAVGAPGAHQSLGWNLVTNRVMEALAAVHSDWVGIVWGRQAAELIPSFGEAAYIRSPHPSPLSAHRGFFGSKPFSRTNDLLVRRGVEPVDWSLRPLPVAS